VNPRSASTSRGATRSGGRAPSATWGRSCTSGKDETIRILSGRLLFETKAKDAPGPLQKLELAPGQSFHITPLTLHRMTALEDTDVLEVSTPELDDVVRLEDRYGRAGTSQP
jgi:hypothetical protein